MVGLKFSDEQEADKFYKAIQTKLKDPQQRRQSRVYLAKSFWYIDNAWYYSSQTKEG